MSVSLLTSNVKVTGSNIIYDPNFSGIGGTQVIRSGNFVLISGGANGGNNAPGGVTGVNFLTGNVPITGTGNISVFVLNGNIVISGNNNDAVNLSGALQQSGSNLYNLIINQSGQFENNLVHRTGNELITGNKTFNGNISLLSGEYQFPWHISDNYNIKNTDRRLYCDNPTGIRLLFPSAISSSGQFVGVKLLNTGQITITGTFGQKFDGLDSIIQSGRYFALECHSDGANWYLW